MNQFDDTHYPMHFIIFKNFTNHQIKFDLWLNFIH